MSNEYLNFKEKFPTLINLENENILWNIHTHVDYLSYILLLNLFNQSNQTFTILCDTSNYSRHLNDKISENEIQSLYENLCQFDIGTIIKLNEIFYTKEYQKSFHQLTNSIKVIEASQSIDIDQLRVSDLMFVIMLINNILYFNINYVLIQEDQISLYTYISSFLLNEYEKTLNIIQIPKGPEFFEKNQILLSNSKDQLDVIHNYLKLINDQSSIVREKPPVYIVASFLTDQFHVLKQHWKKNHNKNAKSTGTGQGINGLEANQKGFEPELGGKFVIINWSTKEFVYTLDLDAPAGFFIEDNYLYIANNRLHYISIIDLIRRKEIQRIQNPAFNCLHSLHRAENETFLVTSTGIDAILQIDSEGKILNDWYATEHGYSVTPKGQQRYVQRDFDHNQYNYPTLYQTTHINSAIIFDSNHYLATLFHQGSLVKINRFNGEVTVVLSELKCPHAIKHYRSKKPNEIQWMLCNTKQNEILFLNKYFQVIQKMILEDVNWLQDATQIQNENILFTDANHSTIIEIDPRSNTMISEFSYSIDWRIYQINDLADFRTNFIPNKHESK